MSEPRAEYIVAGEDVAVRQQLCDWCREPIVGMADCLDIEAGYASADRSETEWSEGHSRWFCSRRCMNAWLLAYVSDAPGQHMLVSPEDARALARCEYTRVLGCDDVVDVRMDRALWERVRDAARGEER